MTLPATIEDNASAHAPVSAHSVSRLFAIFFRLGATLLALAAFVGLSSTVVAQPSADLVKKLAGAASADALLTAARRNGHVRVIVAFRSSAPPVQPGAANVPQITAHVAAERGAILTKHFGDAANPAAGKDFARALTSFPVTPGFAVNVSASELEALAADPLIVTIQYDAPEQTTPAGASR